MKGKRNSIDETTPNLHHEHGSRTLGGGSAAGTGTPPGGGGYPETCTGLESEKSRAPAADEWLKVLEGTGISEALLRVARRIGFEAFMAMWSELDSDDSLLDEKRKIRIPHMEATLFRAQRVRIIRALGDQGRSPRQIIEALPRQLRVGISRRSVHRILRNK